MFENTEDNGNLTSTNGFGFPCYENIGAANNDVSNFFQSAKPLDDEILEDEKATKKARRRTTECTELSKRFEYRRAFSEVKMLEAMEYVKLEKGTVYNFITAGDVDSLSYLKIVLNQHDLDYMLLSTWCMAAEDILQIQQWYEAGKIKKFDMYLGEIFPNSYKIEWGMVKRFYEKNPDVGRAAVFRNHSRIYAGYNIADDFYFGIQTSANINTNPRTENGCITVDKGLFDFYKAYFDGIQSFEK